MPRAVRGRRESETRTKRALVGIFPLITKQSHTNSGVGGGGGGGGGVVSIALLEKKVIKCSAVFYLLRYDAIY
jgi:hypothetical protein